MKPTEEESAALKTALKHSPVTDELRQEVVDFPLEANEAILEVEDGFDTCTPDSWVAEILA